MTYHESSATPEETGTSEEMDLEQIASKMKEALNTEPNKIRTALGNSENTGEASPETCTRVLKRVQKEIGGKALLSDVAITVVCLVQKGATSPKTPGGTKFAYNTALTSVEQIRKACREEKITVRQFARGMKDKIIDFMLSLGDDALEGNLSKAMKLELKGVTREEAIWASDFQTYNDRCPTRVRNWLVKNYRARFRK